MRKNKFVRMLGSGLVSLAMAGGCSHANHAPSASSAWSSHSPFSARAWLNQESRAVNLEVSDPAGIFKVEIYRDNKLVGKYNLKLHGSPSNYLIKTKITEDGTYFFKIYGENNETDFGFFEKRGEKVSPEFQGCN